MQSNNITGCVPSEFDTEPCKSVVNELSKIFKNMELVYIEPYEVYNLSGPYRYTSASLFLTLSNGSTFSPSLDTYQITQNEVAVKKYGTHLKSRVGNFKIDVNGKQKPNKLGRDIFDFILSEDGNVYPTGGLDHSVFFKGNTENKWNSSGSIWHNCYPDRNYGANGYACAARIMEEGGMNY